MNVETTIGRDSLARLLDPYGAAHLPRVPKARKAAPGIKHERRTRGLGSTQRGNSASAMQETSLNLLIVAGSFAWADLGLHVALRPPLDALGPQCPCYRTIRWLW